MTAALGRVLHFEEVPVPRDTVLLLRECRRLKGLSQKEAAALSGVGEKTISSFETGARIHGMRLDQLQALLDVYGICAADFFNGHLEGIEAGPITRLPGEPQRPSIMTHVDRVVSDLDAAVDEGFSAYHVIDVVQSRGAERGWR
jgi:transcriptional regulator with XRE-family HTH domain